jgi:ketosteroid isomerase-like protein
MSEGNVELLRPIYAEWARGNFAYRPSVYAADMEWGWSEEFPGLEGVGRDPEHDASSSRLQQWLKEWEDWRCEAERYVAEGDHVVVMCQYRGEGKTSGVDVDTIGAHHWVLRDGEVIRLEIFSSRSRALAAAGISE